MLRYTWARLYGKGSKVNLAEKLLIGVPMAPLVLIFMLTWVLLDALSPERKA